MAFFYMVISICMIMKLLIVEWGLGKLRAQGPQDLEAHQDCFCSVVREFHKNPWE